MENLEVHLRLLRLPRERVDEVLAVVGLRDAANQRVGSYSLGMKPCLRIVIALLGDPELQILAEPANGLDPIGVHEMRGLTRSLHARGITLVISSHLLAEAQQMVTHVGILAGGRLHYQGPWDSADLEAFFMKTVARHAHASAGPEGGDGR
ncbi:P-loop NTPase family protein [Geochorda subterranea]|uniref:ABC-2 type transport system ATP-binding protein n=1 Tax=Geochorda subterranea TaxID=3109564 RepID=A0ABZ1BPN7_9FIRM|nr:hypothetical protein [Limnochorda sp. LNt]WRP14550.1 hypothetical protein VLY81_14225 [Limnochorda sp. LNt]